MVARRSTEALTFDAYTLLQHLPDRVTVTDQDGVILYVNRSFEEVTGYSADEVIGQKPSILKSGEHPDRFYQKLWQTIKSGRPFSRRGHQQKEKRRALLRGPIDRARG